MDDLLNHAPCGFLSFGDDGTITLINRTLLDMLEYEQDVLTGQSVERLFTVGTRIFYQTHFFPLVRMHGHAEEIFLLLRSSSGENVGVLTNAMRRTRDGTVAIDCVFLRVQERQKYESELLRARREAEAAQAEAQRNAAQLSEVNAELEQQALELELTTTDLQTLNEQLEQRSTELERLREEADQANLAKSSFLAMMSHELRTPLNAISGYAELLEMEIQGPITDAQRESLQRIQQSQRHLLRLVNEILNLARIEAGHVEYNIEDVPAGDLMARVLPLVEPQMQHHAIRLEVDVPDLLVVRCDMEKAQQILLNLLSNAIKFTPAGGVISVSAAYDAADNNHVVISVQDTGIGIPQSMIAAIFDPFVQVEMSLSRRGEGTGLGLAISRDLATGMNGRLTATSAEGAGSIFYLTLPAGSEAPAH